MASSGTTNFELDVADIIEESFDNIGREIRSGNDLRSARRSLNLLLQEMSNSQINLWKAIYTIVPLAQGVASYDMEPAITDVVELTLRRGGIDTTMHRLARAEYQTRPNKLSQGRPSQYFFERLMIPRLHIYPVPTNSTDEVRLFALTRIDDVGEHTNTLDIPVRFLPAIVSGLSYKLAVKFAAEKAQGMKLIYDQEIMNAQYEDRDRASLSVVPQVGRLR